MIRSSPYLRLTIPFLLSKSLLMLAGAFAVIGVAALLLTPVIPAMLGLAGAIALLGVGALACGVGILALSAGLSALAVSGAAGIAALVLAVEALISLIPSIAIKIGEGIVDLIVFLGNNTPPVIEAVVNILLAALAALRTLVPDLVETILVFVDATLNSLAEHTPSMVAAGIGIVVGLIEGLAQGIEDNKERIKAAFESLFQSLIDLVLELLGIHSPSTVFSGIGSDIILGAIKGIGERAGELLGKMKQIVDDVVGAIKEKLSQFYEKGKEFISKIWQGIDEKKAEIKTKIKGTVSDAIDGIRSKIEDFKSAGKDMMRGLKNGIEEFGEKVKTAVGGIASGAVSKLKGLLGIHSPSRVMRKLGNQTGEGFSLGLLDTAEDISLSGKNIGKKAVSSMSKTLNLLSDAVDRNYYFEPTIRPVLDLSEIQNGSRRISGLLPADVGYSVGTSYNLASRALRTPESMGRYGGANVGITMNNSFNNANARDGMALLNMLNRELGGAL